MRVIAARYWGAQACGGNYQVTFGISNDSLTEQFAAWAGWDSPTGPNDLAADPATYTNCRVGFTVNSGYTDALSIYDSWLDFCPEFLHEVGHLRGRAHVPGDPTNIMYPGGAMESNRPSLPRVCLVQPNGVRWHITVAGNRDWSEHVGRPSPATIPMDRRPLGSIAP